MVLEVRNDLIATDGMADDWAMRLAPAIEAAVASAAGSSDEISPDDIRPDETETSRWPT